MWYTERKHKFKFNSCPSDDLELLRWMLLLSQFQVVVTLLHSGIAAGLNTLSVNLQARSNFSVDVSENSLSCTMTNFALDL